MAYVPFVGGEGGRRGTREEIQSQDEQKKSPDRMYFDFSDCCHVALLAANCNCQLKQWGKLLPLPSTADVHVSTAGTAVYFLGWLKDEYFFHILLHWFCILLWKGLL